MNKIYVGGSITLGDGLVGMNARREAAGARWSQSDADGRQTCLVCAGNGELALKSGPVECANCAGDGYRWPD